MTLSKPALVFGFAALIAWASFHFATAQTPAPAPAPTPVVPKDPDPKILPLVVLKQGETKELIMTTQCRVGATRGGGLSVKPMGDTTFTLNPEKIWKKDGLSIQVPDFAEAEKGAEKPEYAPLREKGLNAFVVKVTAADDAKAGLLDFHLADSTCSGHCMTDFRVLVLAK